MELYDLPSLNKTKSDIDNLKFISKIMGQGDEIKELEIEFDELINTSNKFKNYFSNLGWIIHGLLDVEVMKKAVQVFEENSIEEAEMVLVDYYSNSEDLDIKLSILNNVEEFSVRYQLIRNAFKDHLEGRYYASVPVLLIIVDGVVNDFTRSKGFFAAGTDVSAWDCIVGSQDGLVKAKELFNKNRKKTSSDEITIPYRNGILHGRDLNYSNAVVSAKCIGLVFTVFDWICRKNDEEVRKEKLHEEMNPPSLYESINKIQEIKKNDEIIKAWSRENFIVGTHFPESGSVEDYKDIPFLIPVIEFFELWKAKNFGKLAVHIDKVYMYEKNIKIRPKLCREQFGDIEFQEFKIKKVEDKAISLKKVVTEVTSITLETTKTMELEFIIIYENDTGNAGLPPKNNGKWKLKPKNLWNIRFR